MKRVLALALVAALAACSRSGETGPAATAELAIAQQREPMSLNPALENGAHRQPSGGCCFFNIS